MFSDIYESIHSDDLGETVGSFHWEPVRSWNPSSSRERDDRYARLCVLTKQGDGIPADVLPGQIVCVDNTIRRETTAEAIGYDEFHNSAANATGRRVTIAEALVLSSKGAFINWRPDGNCGPDAYALVVGEDAVLATAAA